MSSLEDSSSPQSQSAREEDREQDRDSGDQNRVEGDVTNGGISIQGGDRHNINITQNFNAPSPTKDSPLTNRTIEIKDFEPETILIPAGSFLMGTRTEAIKLLIEKFGGDEDNYKNETPQQEVSLSAYRIGKYPVTNAQYKVFIDETEADKRQALITPIMGWDYSLNIPDGRDDFPVAGVTWYQALAYCQWLEENTGRNYQLPNEAQWEKACRGGKNCLFPWSDEFDATRCNQGNSELAPVDPKKPAQNEYGVFDFVGNVRQWTCSLWGTNFLVPEAKYAYPWRNEPRRHDVNANSQIRRIVRGSSFNEEQSHLRCNVRKGELPDEWVAGIGFRVAIVE